jgi:hypothetical protein
VLIYPLDRSNASWTTTLYASFRRLFFIKYCFKVPPARYSTTTQHARVGKLARAPLSLAGILRSVVPIDAPINCRRYYNMCLSTYREEYGLYQLQMLILNDKLIHSNLSAFATRTTHISLVEMDMIGGSYVWLEILTLVTLGWLSLCQTATSCLNDVRKAAVSDSVAKPSSPQSNSFTAYNMKKHYNFYHEMVLI